MRSPPALGTLLSSHLFHLFRVRSWVYLQLRSCCLLQHTRRPLFKFFNCAINVLCCACSLRTRLPENLSSFAVGILNFFCRTATISRAQERQAQIGRASCRERVCQYGKIPV